MIAICFILGLLIIGNRVEIERLKEKIKKLEQIRHEG